MVSAILLFAFGQSSFVAAYFVKTKTGGIVRTISNIFSLESTFQHEQLMKTARRKAWKSNYWFPKMPEGTTMMTGQAVF